MRRGAIDISSHRNLTPAVAERRARLYAELMAFVQMTLQVSMDAFLHIFRHCRLHISHLRALLFVAGRPLWCFSELINAMVDRRRNLKGNIQSAWDAGMGLEVPDTSGS